jgi:hypothetical protein
LPHPVDIHAYADRIVIKQDGVIVGEHARRFARDQTAYDPWHYVPVLARKPGALRNGAPFKDWPRGSISREGLGRRPRSSTRPPGSVAPELRWKLALRLPVRAVLSGRLLTSPAATHGPELRLGCSAHSGPSGKDHFVTDLSSRVRTSSQWKTRHFTCQMIEKIELGSFSEANTS